MGHVTDLTSIDSHFDSGRNWRSSTVTLTGSEIHDATKKLRRLLAADSLAGRSVLDIGRDYGIHALADLRPRATDVAAFDIDPDSVATAEQLIAGHAPASAADVRLGSIFEIDTASFKTLNVVHSRRVPHHTGRMHEPLRRAAALVRPSGTFAFVLYRWTWCRPLWTIEKRGHRDAAESRRQFARNAYVTVVRLGMLFTERSYDDYLA